MVISGTSRWDGPWCFNVTYLLSRHLHFHSHRCVQWPLLPGVLLLPWPGTSFWGIFGPLHFFKHARQPHYIQNSVCLLYDPIKGVIWHTKYKKTRRLAFFVLHVQSLAFPKSYYVLWFLASLSWDWWDRCVFCMPLSLDAWYSTQFWGALIT